MTGFFFVIFIILRLDKKKNQPYPEFIKSA